MAMLFAMCCLTFVVLRRRLLHTIDNGNRAVAGLDLSGETRTFAGLGCV